MTNAEARFNNSLRPRKPEGSLGRTAQDVHLDSHTAPELCFQLNPGGAFDPATKEACCLGGSGFWWGLWVGRSVALSSKWQ